MVKYAIFCDEANYFGVFGDRRIEFDSKGGVVHLVAMHTRGLDMANNAIDALEFPDGADEESTQ